LQLSESGGKYSDEKRDGVPEIVTKSVTKIVTRDGKS
jgi:hypothetical protein